jgi:hypothetical protein
MLYSIGEVPGMVYIVLWKGGGVVMIGVTSTCWKGLKCIVCLVIVTYDYYCNKFGYICAASRAHFMVLDAKVMAMMFAKP